MTIFNNIYKGKTVLVTGHTGFKGSWLCIWLNQLGAKVIGYSLDPATEKDNFVLTELSQKMIDIRGDIRDTEKLKQLFEEHKPEIVFHLAAQPLVRYSYTSPQETYEVNVIGTVNVLEAIRHCNETKIGIFITTDKCYENKEQIWGYKESDPLGGYDPYSSSKGACEIAINSWRQSYFNPLYFDKHQKSIASVRAGNVIGGGDWSSDRIVPDCIRSLEKNMPINIRSPKAIRPWQFVLEPLYGYLLLGQKMLEDPVTYCEGWNFGPMIHSITSVGDIAETLVKTYGSGEIQVTQTDDHLHEANLLMLDITKAYFRLGWKPRLSLDETLTYTVDWYKSYKEPNMYDFCVQQINDFMNVGSD